MNLHLSLSVTAALLAIGPASLASAAAPVGVSGIYPHLTVFNSDPKRERPAMENGLGAVVPWAGKLWSLTYTSHDLGRGNDKLFTISPDLTLEIRPESVGGTHACRLIHRESQQLFIGCYAVDAAGKVRVIPRDKLPGRLTALARHLTDPANKVLYLAQEGAVYEVDVHTLAVTELFKKPVEGWHYKGAWTAQGRYFVSANGEEPAPSPFWKVDYTSAATKQLTEDLTSQYLQAPRTPRAAPRTFGQTLWRGVSEDIGSLAEWDGKKWTVLARRQYLDLAGPGGITGATSDDEPVWAMGWDLRSAFVHVRENSGRWTLYRLPKASYTADGVNGSNTEWPRINAIGDGRRLMFLHNGIYEFPANFRPGQTAGLRPFATSLVTITDMAPWQGRLVISQQATSVHGIPFHVPGQPNSNVQFLEADALASWGPRAGFGGVWVDDAVKAGTPSEPYLIGGYTHRTVHLAHQAGTAVTFTLEVDARGDGRWEKFRALNVPARGYAPVVLPATLAAEWLRVTVDRDTVATAYLHVGAPRPVAANEAALFAGLASAATSDPTAGIVRQGFPTRNLQFLAGDGRYYEVDEKLAFHAVDAPAEVAKLRETHALANGFTEDAASIVVTRYDGQRFRLPKGDTALGAAPASRGIRELIQERYLANYHGTFYEVPRGGTSPSGQRNMPDFQRMKPVATHNRRIADFCTHRGLLVLSGVRADAANDGHVFRAAPGGPALWFGAIDDLWKLGAPRGRGGPWQDTTVQAGVPSDPYLMTGYNRKSLALAHDAQQPVEFAVQVDFYASGQWHEYRRITVPPGETVAHVFPDGYSAHWVRIVAERSCTATAQLRYEP
jgi:hypothetical protein